MLGHFVAKGVMKVLVPKDANVRWYHVPPILGVCVLVFAGTLALVTSILMGDTTLALIDLGLVGLGVVGGLAVRQMLQPPALVIGHRRDPIHPFSDSGALVDELPNARLVQAESVVELLVTPERLTDEIAAFLDECWGRRRRRRAAAGARSAA